VKKKRKYQSRKTGNKNYKLILTILIVGVLILMFSDLGLIDYFSLKKTEKALIAEIRYMKNQAVTLKSEYTKLTTDDDYIIQIAREKFRMVKPGEKVFKVIDRRTVE